MPRLCPVPGAQSFSSSFPGTHERPIPVCLRPCRGWSRRLTRLGALQNTKWVNSVGFPVEQSTGHIHPTRQQQRGQLNQDMTPPTVPPKPSPLHPTAKLPTTATTATQQNTQHKLTTPTNRLQQPPHTHVAMTRGGRCLGSHSNVG